MSMDTQSAKLFSELIARGPAGLTPDEAAFLRARRDYMSDQQREEFAEVISPKVEKVKQAEASKPTEPKLDRRALWKEAKGMGITLDQEMTAPQIKALIDQAKFDQEAAKEEAEARAAERKALEDRAVELGVEDVAGLSDEDLVTSIQLAVEAKEQAEASKNTPDSKE